MHRQIPTSNPGFPMGVQGWRNLASRGMAPLRTALEGFADISPASDPAWISVINRAGIERELSRLESLLRACTDPENDLPLLGVPVAVKDNIDVEGFPTTAACPDFAFIPFQDAQAVKLLKDKGAVVVGKTNLDQFATGLVGTRSPYGSVPSAFDDSRIGGGSSSGSASVVSRGLVPLALGTDTAGSGRVPAGFQNVVGLKPTRGWISTRGVVPACRTLDCVSVFALDARDAWIGVTSASGSDPSEPYSRSPRTERAGFSPQPIFAIPDTLEFFGDEPSRKAFERSLDLLRADGARIERVDFAPFAELAALLYQGPWVAERLSVAGALLERSPDSVHRIVREIMASGARHSALDAFRAEYRRTDLASRIARSLEGFDALVVPTAPMFPTFVQVASDPVGVNSRLGFYTNFANLADLCALSLPGAFREDALPAGITLLAPAWHDQALAVFGDRWCERLPGTGRGPWKLPTSGSGLSSDPCIKVAVVGAHLSGMPLNHQLLDRGARLLKRSRTTPAYGLFALAGTTPAKPGLVRGAGQGSIELELWAVPPAHFGSFVALVPAPLGIGNVQLEDGTWVKGFICEGLGLEGATDITEYGGWRAWLASGKTPSTPRKDPNMVDVATTP